MESVRTQRVLPPLILHPFDQRSDSNELEQVTDCDPMTRRYLQTRYDEFRMLCLVGMDLNRWLEQCAEVVALDPDLAGLSESNFIAMLFFAPPLPVLQKMRKWGVKNYQVIFSRAIGLNVVFPHPPAAKDVSEVLLRSFHKYADALYDVRLKSEDSSVTLEDTFIFEIYASGEYSSYLSKARQE